MTTMIKNIDELSTAMRHPKVVDAYSKSLQPVLLLTIDEAFNTRLSVISDTKTKLSDELRTRGHRILQLKQENQELRNTVLFNSKQIEALEPYSHVNNLLIYGLSETYAETTVKSITNQDGHNEGESAMQLEINFVELCHNKLHVSIQPQDISICHRLSKSQNLKIRPMIVRFAS